MMNNAKGDTTKLFHIEHIKNIAKAFTICENGDCPGDSRCQYHGVCSKREYALSNDIIAALSQLATMLTNGMKGQVVYDIIVGDDYNNGRVCSVANTELYAVEYDAKAAVERWRQKGYSADYCIRRVQ